ncbi:MAG: ATP-binding cassette domain-containing protein [Nodosilinea sp. LVE1205-7]|jgi:cobalt/nickel transport system ATP-binding protein
MHHNPITIENLSYAYEDGTTALSQINLAVAAGERVALVGANGSGKSTLLLHLNGILWPQSGRITVGNIPFSLTMLRLFVISLGWCFRTPTISYLCRRWRRILALDP